MTGAFIHFYVTKELPRDYVAGEFLDVYEGDKRITVKLVHDAIKGTKQLDVVPIIVESEV